MPLSSSKKFDIYVGGGGPLYLIVDIEGYSIPAVGAGFTTASTPISVSPGLVIPANGYATVPISGNDSGVPGYDSFTTSIATNMTVAPATSSTSSGYLDMWPADQPEPATSVLNYATSGASRSALVMVPVSSDDLVSIHNAGSADISVRLDVEGWSTDLSASHDNSLSDMVTMDSASGTVTTQTSPSGMSPSDVTSVDADPSVTPASTGAVDVGQDVAPVQADSVTPISDSAVSDNTRGIIGPDGRTRVNPTTSYPWRTVVQMQFKEHGSNGYYICSGSLIAVDVVLIAGHCLFDNNGWNTNFTIWPAKNGSYLPYGSCGVKWLSTVKGWYTSSGQKNGTTNGYDYGVIKLNCSVGRSTGCLGWSNHAVTGQSLRITGYPGEKPNGTMWTEAGTMRLILRLHKNGVR